MDAEADGLRHLAPAIRVPAVVHAPLAGGQALILEWLDTRPWAVANGKPWAPTCAGSTTPPPSASATTATTGSAPTARTTPHRPLGGLLRRTPPGPQLRQARDRGLPPRAVQAVEAVMARAPDWLAGLDIRPALVHGDLWQGNVAALADGTPVIYDPAAHYGHGETDLAMLGLFGAVPDALYHAYGQDPHDRDFQHRTRLYNLYHLLNHHNLFGGPYTQTTEDSALPSFAIKRWLPYGQGGRGGALRRGPCLARDGQTRAFRDELVACPRPALPGRERPR
ncbi:fructosamine kinase [Alcanivorax sp. IO_7]|nr:fructosamine kinase [Alcanivorax sp. IO_7]